MEAEVLATIKATLGQYPNIRSDYYDEVFVAVYDYLDSSGSITTFKNAMKRAVGTGFPATGDAAWEDGGGALPIDPEISDWLGAMQDAEIGYIDALFQTLKQVRGSEDLKPFEYASARAEGYAKTLDRIYNYVKIAAAGSVMLTFMGDDGTESCTDCQKYKGQRHKASWWIKNNAVPPNRDFECGGYNCQHLLVSDDGIVWTV